MAHGDIVLSRYWNTNGTPVAIVAIEGGAHDVGAYIGGDPNYSRRQEETLRWVAENGAKLSRDDAFRFLPGLADIHLSYRD